MLTTIEDLEKKRRENNKTLTQSVPPAERQQALKINEQLKALEAYAKQLKSISWEELITQYIEVTDSVIQNDNKLYIADIMEQLQALMDTVRQFEIQNEEYRINAEKLSVLGTALKSYGIEVNEALTNSNRSAQLVIELNSEIDKKRVANIAELEQRQNHIRQQKEELKQEKEIFQRERAEFRTEKTAFRKERDAAKEEFQKEKATLQKEKANLKEAIRVLEEQQKNFKNQARRLELEQDKQEKLQQKELEKQQKEQEKAKKQPDPDYKELMIFTYGRNKALNMLREEGYDV